MKEKIVLFQGSASAFGKKIDLAPLALLAVASFLHKDGMQVKIIAPSLYNDYMKQAIKDCQGSICLGITAMTGTQIAEGLEIAKLVKDNYPHLPIVWGGWHPSILPESTIKDPLVDIVVCGQGERKFYEIVECLRAGLFNDLKNIPGVSYKSDSGIILNKQFSIEDMNNFPRVPYDIVDVEKCLNKTEYGNRTIQYISSYGCPCRCSFCIEPVVNQRRWVSLAAARVVDEWEYLYKKYKIDSIAVYDSNFFVNKKRVMDICDGLIKKNIKIKWGNANGRIPTLVKYEEDVWQLMKDAGLKMILTGSESGEQKVLDLINKDASMEDIYKFTALCDKYDIKVLFSYMSGIPWSGELKFNAGRVKQEVDSMLTQTDKLMKISKKNRFMVYAYTPLPGSSMYDMAKKHGFQEPRTLRGWSELTYSPEDIFKKGACRQKWISDKQFRLITMLEQYIFGMMDLDARDWLAQGINNKFFRIIFKMAFNAGYLMARIRLQFKFFALPVDYWLFVKLRKLIRM
ncbi:MAG: B12-binding domain-containing radical SAM protein [Candidatus Omnitrophica bacterium]|nr:B12-binding domain-containing radical SAM protein [Candidatus Omnitrophota bacterium]